MSSSAGFLSRHFPTFRSALGNLGWPILLRQLRADLRRSRFFVVQFVCLAVLGMALLAVIVTKVEDPRLTASQIGRNLFALFFVIQYLVVLVIFPAFSATAFTEERAGKTIDLLLTTDLRPEEVVWGKFLAATTYCLLYVIASVPLLSISFLFGGVEPAEVLIAYGVLVALTLLVSIFGVCVSSFFGASMRSTLCVYTAMAALIVVSVLTYLRLQEETSRAGAPSLVRALIEDLAPGGGYAYAWILVAGSLLAFAYLFVLTANRLRPASHDRSSGPRALTLSAIVILSLARLMPVAQLGGLAGGASAARVSAAFESATVSAFVVLLLVALFSSTEEAAVSRRNRRRFGSRSLVLRIFAPGAFWGFVYTVAAAIATCAALFVAWLALGPPSPLLGGQVPEALITLPLYISAFAALGFLLAACDFTPSYARLTLFFIFLITLLLPVIFMVSKTPDAVWTCYYLSPITLWTSLGGEIPVDVEPKFVLHGLPVIRIAQAIFASVTVGSFLTALGACRKRGYPTLRL